MIQTKLHLEDFQQLLELGKQLHSESRYSNTTYNEKAIAFLVKNIMERPDKFFICYNKTTDGKINGFFLGTLNFEYFTGKTTAVDMGMYVVPEARGSSVFPRMLKEFEKWAKDCHANKIILYHSTGISPEKSKTLFPKLGFSHYGYIFDKEL